MATDLRRRSVGHSDQLIGVQSRDVLYEWHRSGRGHEKEHREVMRMKGRDGSNQYILYYRYMWSEYSAARMCVSVSVFTHMRAQTRYATRPVPSARPKNSQEAKGLQKSGQYRYCTVCKRVVMSPSESQACGGREGGREGGRYGGRGGKVLNMSGGVSEREQPCIQLPLFHPRSPLLSLSPFHL